MNGGRVSGHAATDPGTRDEAAERRPHPSGPSCAVAEEALHEVRALHRALNGEGTEAGVFEGMRSMTKSDEAMQRQMAALEVKVNGFDHKLDETLRVAKEELLLAKEQVRLANEQALLAKQASAQEMPMWMKRTGWGSVLTVGVFFAWRLLKEFFGP